jgi:hypothetical protein
MKLLVNVNTTASKTETIAGSARSVAAPGTEIVGLTPTLGAESVEGNFESYLAAIGVMNAVITYDGDFCGHPGGVRRALSRGLPCWTPRPCWNPSTTRPSCWPAASCSSSRRSA